LAIFGISIKVDFHQTFIKNEVFFSKDSARTRRANFADVYKMEIQLFSKIL
jgi:hypothetical protein